MQIMPQYASYYAGFKVKKPVLKDSIELNVEISMKMLRDWYNRYNDWGKAAGAYNTGKPIMNNYARNAIKKNYIDHWIRPDSTDVVPDTLAYLARVDLVAFLKD
jgi:soluble lytic murein transglycosylase-like protein